MRIIVFVGSPVEDNEKDVSPTLLHISLKLTDWLIFLCVGLFVVNQNGKAPQEGKSQRGCH